MGKRRLLVAGSAVLLGGMGISGAAIARGGEERLRADLRGTNELPPTDLDAHGRARLTVDLETGEVCFSVRVDDIGTANRGHIHVGDAQTNGDIVVPLFELRPQDAPATDPRHDELEQGRLEDCVAADPALVQAIADNPEGYYVNLHNARFPAGAARGQLED